MNEHNGIVSRAARLAFMVSVFFGSVCYSSDFIKIDSNKKESRYIVKAKSSRFYVGYFKVSGTQNRAERNVSKISLGLCKRLGFEKYRFANLKEIIDDEILYRAMSIHGSLSDSGSERISRVVIFFNGKSVGRLCLTQKELMKKARKELRAKRKD